MAPGIGFHSDTSDRATETDHVAKERFFDNDNHQEDQQRERCRRGMRQKQRARAFHRKRDGCDEHTARHKNCGQRFGFTVAVRMGLVRRSRRKSQPPPDDDRTCDIERGFDSIRDERVSVPENTTADFDDGEGDVHHQTNQRETRAGLQIGRGRLRMRRRIHGRSKTIKAIVYERHGNPAEVLQIQTQPWPTLGPDEAVVAMRAAPINPADINAIEGKYPGRSEVPAVPGFEGAGVVVEIGADVSTITKGALVILPHNIGTWREALAVKASELVPVPPEIGSVHAAMLKINPMTALRLLHDYVDLAHSDWLIQNACNSAAGRAVIQIAHELGFKTVNVVRRGGLIDELRAEGGDVVLVDNEKLRDEVKNATSGAPIRLGLNSVGGDSGLRRANCLAFSGTLVSFGAMSLQPLKIPTGLLIFKDLRFRGIWINKWYDDATMQERMEAFRALFEMAKRGLLKTKVEKAYAIDEAKAAVVHAAQSKRSGKIILEFDHASNMRSE